MNKAEKTHLDRVAQLGCIVCRNRGDMDSPAVIHHINWYSMGKKAPNMLVIPLCPAHHTDPGAGVHGGKETWEMQYGTEMELLSQTYELLYEETDTDLAGRANIINYFHKKAALRAERMEKMKEWYIRQDDIAWDFICVVHPEIEDWFDDQGRAK